MVIAATTNASLHGDHPADLKNQVTGDNHQLVVYEIKVFQRLSGMTHCPETTY